MSITYSPKLPPKTNLLHIPNSGYIISSMLEGSGIISRGRFHWEIGLCWVIYVGDEVDEAIVPHELGLPNEIFDAIIV
jgi:hypothetical protein